MPVSSTIRVLCVKLGISVAELARRYGTTPQAFSHKMQREAFTPAELDKIARAVGCKYESAFILPDGERLTDQYQNTTKGEIKTRYLTNQDIERRCRYRLALHGLKMHKVKGSSEPVYYLYEAGADDTIPDESARFSLDKLKQYCEVLEERDKLERSEK